MPFEFVDNASIDRDARKRIRSHAARGKNVGKTHPSRKRRTALKTQTAEKTGSPTARHFYTTVPLIERQIGDSLSVIPLPVELIPESRTLVQKAFFFLINVPYNPGLSSVVEFVGHKSIWVSFLFQDEAYFHCSIAMCLTAANSLVVTQDDYREAIRHLSASLRLVNERLSGEQALSDTTIASVVAMYQYERLRGQHNQALVHFQGLQRMIELRGGVSRLAQEKPALVQKVFRADIQIALYLGMSTRFSVEEVPGAAAIDWLRQKFGDSRVHHLCQSYPFSMLHTGLQDVLVDIAGFASFLNKDAGDDVKINGHTYHEALLLLGYRLFRQSPLKESRYSSTFEGILHLGLAIFISTFLLSHNHEYPDLPVLRELTLVLAQEDFGEDNAKEEVLLWVLFLGGISLFKGNLDGWLIQRTVQSTKRLGLQSWDDVCQVFSKSTLPWVRTLHDSSGRYLWDQLHPFQ
ncbi:hypothetical protein M426DRAFT_267228 [Hypoxylon sp. CI-4A]|nr:hypothetical protein M426DRAFT_267228 [Hypoxylon sp. CI-4A]